MTPDRPPARECRLIAFYLPQFHPIPENDLWWGKGFTEWTHVKKARPMYPGHSQPKLPGELGYYNLLEPEIRHKQAALAARYGIEAFCYWHYWFGNGKQLLEKPFNEVLRSGQPEFPFCLGWANHSWTQGEKDPENILINQTYPGIEDHIRHFHALEKAFHDKRYLRVDGKPLLFIFVPDGIPRVEKFLACWNDLARKSGLPGIYFIAHLNRGNLRAEMFIGKGFDAATTNLSVTTLKLRNPVWVRACVKAGLHVPTIFPYRTFTSDPIFSTPLLHYQHAMIFPNWDDTPRRRDRGFVLTGSTPEAFRRHVREVLATTTVQTPQRRLIFIRSWNEWAEGNYMEPDQRYGRRYLEVLQEEVRRAFP